MVECVLCWGRGIFVIDKGILENKGYKFVCGYIVDVNLSDFNLVKKIDKVFVNW